MLLAKYLISKYGERRLVGDEWLFVWKLNTPNYIKQLYLGLKKSKQQRLL